MSALELYRTRPAVVHARATADRRIEVFHRGGVREVLDLAVFAARYTPAEPADLLDPPAASENGAERPRTRPAKRGGVKAARKPRAAAPRKGGVGPKWDVERGLQLRKAGKTDAAIGAAVGASGVTVNAYARAHGWPKRGKPAQPAGTPSPRGRRKVRTGGTETPARVCVKCQQRTTKDPCEHCGAAYTGAEGL